MKKHYLLLSICTLFIYSCNQEQKIERTVVTEVTDSVPVKSNVEIKKSNYIYKKPEFDTEYTIGAGILFWKGTSIKDFHNGAVHLTDGFLYVNNGQLVGFDVEIPIDGLVVTDLYGDERFELENELKSKDFFNTAQYPKGKFYFKEIELTNKNNDFPYEVIGDLELMGITNEISFPISYTNKDSIIYIGSNHFFIDRTKWGLTYKSTVLGIPLDKALSNDIRFKLKFYAHKVKKKN